MVHSFYITLRAIFELMSCKAFAMASVQLYRDKNAFRLKAKAAGTTHIVFRKVAWLASLCEILFNIDTFGVFGIWNPVARLVFKALSFLWISLAMVTYLYYAAKGCFPFVFRERSGEATIILRWVVASFFVMANVFDFVNDFVRQRDVLLAGLSITIFILASALVAAYAMLYRLQTVLRRSNASGKYVAQTNVAITKWRTFTVLFSMLLVTIMTPTFLLLAEVLRQPTEAAATEQMLVPFEQRYLVDPDASISTFVVVETILRVATILSTFLFLYRAWIPAGENGEIPKDIGVVRGSDSLSSGRRRQRSSSLSGGSNCLRPSSPPERYVTTSTGGGGAGGVVVSSSGFSTYAGSAAPFSYLVPRSLPMFRAGDVELRGSGGLGGGGGLFGGHRASLRSSTPSFASSAANSAAPLLHDSHSHSHSRTHTVPLSRDRSINAFRVRIPPPTPVTTDLTATPPVSLRRQRAPHSEDGPGKTHVQDLRPKSHVEELRPKTHVQELRPKTRGSAPVLPQTAIFASSRRWGSCVIYPQPTLSDEPIKANIYSHANDIRLSNTPLDLTSAWHVADVPSSTLRSSHVDRLASQAPASLSAAESSSIDSHAHRNSEPSPRTRRSLSVREARSSLTAAESAIDTRRNNEPSPRTRRSLSLRAAQNAISCDYTGVTHDNHSNGGPLSATHKPFKSVSAHKKHTDGFASAAHNHLGSNTVPAALNQRNKRHVPAARPIPAAHNHLDNKTVPATRSQRNKRPVPATQNHFDSNTVPATFSQRNNRPVHAAHNLLDNKTVPATLSQRNNRPVPAARSRTPENLKVRSLPSRRSTFTLSPKRQEDGFRSSKKGSKSGFLEYELSYDARRSSARASTERRVSLGVKRRSRPSMPNFSALAKNTPGLDASRWHAGENHTRAPSAFGSNTQDSQRNGYRPHLYLADVIDLGISARQNDGNTIINAPLSNSVSTSKTLEVESRTSPRERHQPRLSLAERLISAPNEEMSKDSAWTSKALEIDAYDSQRAQCRSYLSLASAIEIGSAAQRNESDLIAPPDGGGTQPHSRPFNSNSFEDATAKKYPPFSSSKDTASSSTTHRVSSASRERRVAFATRRRQSDPAAARRARMRLVTRPAAVRGFSAAAFEHSAAAHAHSAAAHAHSAAAHAYSVAAYGRDRTAAASPPYTHAMRRRGAGRPARSATAWSLPPQHDADAGPAFAADAGPGFAADASPVFAAAQQQPPHGLACSAPVASPAPITWHAAAAAQPPPHSFASRFSSEGFQ